MTVSYILLIVLLVHLLLFRRLIFNWNVFGVFFISTLIFSTFGILAFPFFKSYFLESFASFKLILISDEDVMKTQVMAVFGLLFCLYAYIGVMVARYGRVKCINQIKINGEISDNLGRVNFYFLVLLIGLFILTCLILYKDILVLGIVDGMLGRNPDAILESRRGITSNYLYTVVTYNVMPFMTVVFLYLSIRYKDFSNRLLFFLFFLGTFFLMISLFQKRPLIVFLLSLFLAGFIFRTSLRPKKIKPKKVKKKGRRKIIIYGFFLFVLLITLYYSATTYNFKSIFEAVVKLSEIAFTRIFGRLSIPSFFYVHYFPDVGDHYGFTNIGMLSKLLGFENFADTKEIFNHFSTDELDGSVAINSVMDFYGGFGYYGLFFGNLFLGATLGVLDVFLNKLKKNNINLIFTIFCFVFAYYLSQASLARSLMGYGFFFFLLNWIFLQKDFKIQLRKLY